MFARLIYLFLTPYMSLDQVYNIYQ